MNSNGEKCHAEDPSNCRFHHTGRYATGAWSEEAVAARTPRKKVEIPAPFDSRRAQSLLKYAFQKPMELVRYAPPELSDIELKEDAHNLPVEKAIAATMPFAEAFGKNLAEKVQSVSDAKQKVVAQLRSIRMENGRLAERLKDSDDESCERLISLIHKNNDIIIAKSYEVRDYECRAFAEYFAHGSSPNDVAFDIDGSVDKGMSDTLRIVANALFDKKIATVEVAKVVTTPKPRSESTREQISFSETEDSETLIHEFAHLVEYNNPHVLKRCCEFLEHRCKGEKPQKLAWIDVGNFNDSEVGRKDNFFHAYCGKDYLDERGNRVSTEILSMGVEMMLTHPQMFYENDKEYFSFVLNLIGGRL